MLLITLCPGVMVVMGLQYNDIDSVMVSRAVGDWLKRLQVQASTCSGWLAVYIHIWYCSLFCTIGSKLMYM